VGYGGTGGGFVARRRDAGDNAMTTASANRSHFARCEEVEEREWDDTPTGEIIGKIEAWLLAAEREDIVRVAKYLKVRP
jgi:hypothetical protein